MWEATMSELQSYHEHRELEDVFVLDSTVHGYNFRDENHVAGPFRERVARHLTETLWAGHVGSPPFGDTRYLLDRARFECGNDPELLGRALFAESDTDVCIYHGVPLYGIYADGGSALWVGEMMREQWPDRVALYGPVSPWQPDALEVVEEMLVERRCVGIKMYPMDIVEGEVKSYRLDDPEIAYPILERIQQLGGTIVATHKAVPQGQVPSEPFAPWDVAGAASAFPGLTFEVVHGGFAYLEETAWQLQRFPNVTVNLETAAAFLLGRQPRRFGHLIGQLLFMGGGDRIFWSSGATARHPQPYLQMFWDYEMPEDLQEKYGYPALTREIKEAILGRNHARVLGWDVQKLREQIGNDEFGLHKKLAEPWSGTAA
jgi:uncharacterized protein